MRIPPPIVTKEHGSWAVLIVPFIIGASFAEGPSWPLAFLACCALGFFMSYVPVQTLWKDRAGARRGSVKRAAAVFWSRVYLGTALVFLVPLLAEGWWYFIPIGALGVLFFTLNNVLLRVRGKSSLSDLAAVAGLTLTAPAAYYAATGTIDSRAFVLWLLSALFFGCSVFYVSVKIEANRRKRTEGSTDRGSSAGLANIIYHGVVVVLVVLLVIVRQVPALAVAAFLPMVVHALAGTLSERRRIVFRNLGFLLLGHSVVFCIALVVIFRS